MSVPCAQCGALDCRPTSLTIAGEDVAVGYLCDGCMGRCLGEAALLRQEFDSMIEAGVSREEANARMIAKIEGRQARS